MTEIRCKKCNRLLMKAIFVYAEIQCPKCDYKQMIGEVDLSEHRKRKETSITYDVCLPLKSGKQLRGGFAQVIVSI